jgi:hypothetical protein
VTDGIDADRLRKAYARLLEARAASGNPPDFPVEEVQALAEGTHAGTDREARLDAILADPRTADEFQFFLDLARDRPAARRAPPHWLPIAASLVIATGVLGLWRTLGTGTEEPLRGLDPTVQLIAPAGGAAIEPGTVFVWHPVENASDYRLEVMDEEGNSLVSVLTIDTTYLMPVSHPPAPGIRYRWWVVARLHDGTELRAEARTNAGR